MEHVLIVVLAPSTADDLRGLEDRPEAIRLNLLLPRLKLFAKSGYERSGKEQCERMRD
jgi:hypothetical protein